VSVAANMANSALISCIRPNRPTADVSLPILIDEGSNSIPISLAVSLSSFRLASRASRAFCEGVFLHSELLFFMLIVLVRPGAMRLSRLFAGRYI